jgi:prolyl-tRNA editing enzyme YbaK/EbsC (Cys-tRNA(Pro) deacylase)
MTEVAHIDTSPHCPSVIRQLLGKLNFREVTDDESLPLAQKVQAILVDDSVGALLILFPQNHLLDLNRITELTGRKLKAVPKESLELMLQRHKLGTLPGLPALTSSPCLYEERILSGPAVLIDSGEPGLLLEISSEDFKTLLTKASAARFGEPVTSVTPNLTRPDDDREEITKAVQNFTARRIQQRLESTVEIPPLADTAQKIIKLRVDPDATIDDITGVVETDRRWRHRW